MKYETGTRLTLIEISSFMAMTTKKEIQITREINGKLAFRVHGKHKEFYLPEFSESTLVFEGWDIPLKIDSEVCGTQGPFSTRIMRGNACLNLVGPIDTIREYVLIRNRNEKFTRLDEVIQIDGEKEIPVFPDVPTHHAVVERIRAQA